MADEKTNEWQNGDRELLRKGTQKYSKGTSSRWEVISEYIGTGRSVEEILKATKTVLLQKPDANRAFDSFFEKRKPGQSIASPLSTRKVEESSPDQTAESTAGKTEVREENSGGHGVILNDDAVVAENGSSSCSEHDVWSVVQERALVQALKTFPKETPWRCERVAACRSREDYEPMQEEICLAERDFRSRKNTVVAYVHISLIEGQSICQVCQPQFRSVLPPYWLRCTDVVSSEGSFTPMACPVHKHTCKLFE
ncbi:hypothetical protein MLD38_008821 [Melastoma candidum]|uniref:Uncharacterized protein n=1 Tax=Melastoma candidum TaxID=119954 RepID=A0ACB9S443_9MYRT|nr:hypothetical protein MLD38_008821 [Melastoma candidum]